MLDGRKYPGGKGYTSDNGTHVPLVASWPGMIGEGGACNDLVDFSDFLSTLCQVAGIVVPSSLKVDGRSFFPQLMGQTGDPREWIYGWYARDGKTKIREWVRNKNFKLYRSGDLFNVKDDLIEEQPLDTVWLCPYEHKTYLEFKQVLDLFKDKRFSITP